MIAGLFLIAALAAAPSQPAPAAPPRFEGLFTDWSGANRQSVAAEREARERPPIVEAETAAFSATAGVLMAPGSRALGERVGEIVSLGDCSEGERMARAAGDFALVAAVRDHCQDKPAAAR
jgi:hypothetical protein